jgi:ribose 5-phosphate isomerase B
MVLVPSKPFTEKIFFGCDHAGFGLKQQVLPFLTSTFASISVEDCGCFSDASVDYPNFAKVVADKVLSQGGAGILICGTGIGMSIAANKIRGIRAAEAWDATSARLSREHNNANILCFGARLVGAEVAFDLTRTWLLTSFLGGRHQGRLDRIHQLEDGG